MPQPEPTDANVTNAPINTNAPNQILVKLQQLESKVASLTTDLAAKDSLIQAQQTQLLTTTQAVAPQAETKPQPFNNVEDMTAYIVKSVEAAVVPMIDSRVGDAIQQLGAVVREATPNAEIWGKSQMAEKIMGELNVSMPVALELAESRMAKEATQAELDRESADKAMLDLATQQASVGNKGSNPANLSSSPQNLTLKQTMEKHWDENNMDEATAAFEKESDLWGVPENPGVRTIIPDAGGTAQ